MSDFNNNLLSYSDMLEYYEKQVEEYEEELKKLETLPDKKGIKQLLIELPNQIQNLENIKLKYEKDIRDLKLLIKGIEKQIEKEKSRIRQNLLTDYYNKYDEYKRESKKLFDKIKESNEETSIKRLYLQEMIKVLKPEKPTQYELEDKANTAEIVIGLENKIEELQEELQKLQDIFDGIKVKLKRLENIFIAIRAYRDIVVAEIRWSAESD